MQKKANLVSTKIKEINLSSSEESLIKIAVQHLNSKEYEKASSLTER